MIQVVTKRWAIFAWFYHWFSDSSDLDPVKCGGRISIAEIQRMYILALKYELAAKGVQLRWKTDQELAETTKDLPALLEKYTQAVRDHEYMTSASQNPLDPFLVSSERVLDDDILSWARYSSGGYTMAQVLAPIQNEETGTSVKPAVTDAGPWEDTKSGRVAPAVGTRRATVETLFRRAFWSRLTAAVVGAVFLVGPMWLLVLRRELFIHLGATTGFVLGFGCVMAFFVEKVDQVFAGTLAYAAVLMVFVGVIMQDEGP
ncbi:hypothetical protein ACJ41O_008951 [Fusarium nematophilum]